MLNKNPTVYSPYSPSSVTYKYPDGTDMTHFSLAYLAGKRDKVQYNPDTREIKYMPEMPPEDENRSVTKQFGEFRIIDSDARKVFLLIIDSDARKVFLPADKVDKCFAILDKFIAIKSKPSRREVDRLLGLLSWCAQVVYGGRAFMHRMRSCLLYTSPSPRD